MSNEISWKPVAGGLGGREMGLRWPKYHRVMSSSTSLNEMA
jgi:hypothetical protein